MKPITSDKAPDWMPAASAFDFPEGERRYGSTGQVWQVRNRQWVRIVKPKFAEESCPGHVASDDPKVCRLCGTHIDSLRIDEQDEGP